MSGISWCRFTSKSYLTAIVDALIADGRVERRGDPVDKRVVRIAVTASGERYLEQGLSFLRQRPSPGSRP